MKLKLSTSPWIAAVLLAPCHAQDDYNSYTDAQTRMDMYAAHVRLMESSPFRDVSWQFVGPTAISGRVTDVAIASRDGDDYTMYVAGASGGVWKTDDGGQTIRPVFEQAASTSIGEVTVAPSNPDIVWIGGGEANIFRSSMAGSGVYKSTDAGRTWRHMGLTGTSTIPRIIIHPDNPDIVYVASSGHEWSHNPERGVYKSTNGGESWERVLYVDDRTGVIDLVIHPTDTDTLYAATWQRVRKRWNDPRNEEGYEGGGIYKSTDAGRTWDAINAGLPEQRWRGRIGIDIARSAPDTLYAFIDNYEPAGGAEGRDAYGRARTARITGAEVYRTDNGGQQWRKVSESNQYMAGLSATYGWVFGQCRVDPNDPETMYIMGLGLNVSRDGAQTFERIGGMHGDHHALWIDPNDPTFLVNGNDGGVNVSTDSGETWQSFTNILPMAQFFNISVDMDEPFRVYGSVQDHGSYRGIVDLSQGRDNIPIQSFESAPGGEGSSHAIDPLDPNIVYSAGFYGSISRSDLGATAAPRGNRGRRGGGRRRQGVSTNIVPRPGPDEEAFRGQWVAPFIISPHNHEVIYHGMNYLFRSDNRGDDFVKISPDLTYNNSGELGDIPYQTLFTISESPLREGLLYVGSDDGRAHVTMDTGKNWAEIMDGIPTHRWISRMEASRFDEATVYMSQNGKRYDDFTPYLWKSTNYGQTWTSIANNIPGGPINVVREDPVNANILYVGTDIGVYVSLDRGATWNSLPAGLPSTFVSDLKIHPRDHIMVISTHGRGIYAIDVLPIRARAGM